jgi:hypothetical protein
MMADNSVVKRKSGKPIRSGEKICVLNVFLRQENPEITLEAVAEMTSQAAGTGKATVYRIQKEASANNNMLASPEQFRTITFLSQKYDDFTKSASQAKVRDFFFCNELPTLNKILAAVNSDADLPYLS